MFKLQQKLTGISGLLLVSGLVIATIPTDKLTRKEYARKPRRKWRKTWK